MNRTIPYKRDRNGFTSCNFCGFAGAMTRTQYYDQYHYNGKCVQLQQVLQNMVAAPQDAQLNQDNQQAQAQHSNHAVQPPPNPDDTNADYDPYDPENDEPSDGADATDCSDDHNEEVVDGGELPNPHPQHEYEGGRRGSIQWYLARAHQPLYVGANITVMESVYVILSMKHEHNLTDVSIDKWVRYSTCLRQAYSIYSIHSASFILFADYAMRFSCHQTTSCRHPYTCCRE